MTDEHSGAGPDPVVPPPPADPDGGASFPHVVPLAPPLSAPAPKPPSTPLPPYAAAMPPAPPTGDHPAFAPAPGYAAPASAPSRNSNALGIILAVVGGLVVLAVVGVAVLIGLLAPSPDESAPAPGPTAFADDPDTSSEEPPADDTPGDESSDAEASGIAERLEAKIDEYKRLRDSGALWDRIPDSDFNRTAVSAFLYLMTDMKVATIWGIDEQQAQEYDDRMAMLEARLLAQEPLGDDIRITLEDRVFTYDGETGEGGYTDK